MSVLNLNTPGNEGARLKSDNNETIDPSVVNESDVMGTPCFVLTGTLANLFHPTQSWVARAVAAEAVVAIIISDHALGVVAPGSSVDVCTVDHRPLSTAHAGAGGSLVHPVFSGMSGGPSALPGTALRVTGGVITWMLVVVVLAALGVGLRDRRVCRTEQRG